MSRKKNSLRVVFRAEENLHVRADGDDAGGVGRGASVGRSAGRAVGRGLRRARQQVLPRVTGT